MALLLILFSLGPQEPKIEDLVLQMSAEGVATRERAASVLLDRWKSWREEDIEFLEKATKLGDAEVAGRAKDALGRIRLRRQLGENLLAVAGLEDAILKGTHVERVQLLETVTERWVVGDIDRADVRAFADVARKRGIEYSLGEVIGGMFSHRLIEPYVTLTIPHLKSPDEYSRALVAGGIGEWRAKEFVPELVPLLRDPSARVRSAAIYALAAAGDASHVAAIAAHLGAGDPDVRAVAAFALSKLKAKDRIADVAQLLKDPVVGPRCSAVRALGDLGAKEYLQAILPFLEDPDRSMRSNAVKAVARLGGAPYARKLAQLMGDPDEFVQRSAAEATAFLASPEAIPDLIPILRHPKYETYHAATTLLVRLDARGEMEKFVAMLKDENPSARDQAARVIGGLNARDQAPAVAGLLEHSHPWSRDSGARVLGEFGAKEYAPRIATLLKDPKDGVRFAAAWALARMDAREFKEKLVEAFKSGNSQERGQLVLPLSWIGKKDEIGLFAPLLKDPDPYTRGHAARVLGKIGGRECARELLPLLKDEVWHVRWAALEALGDLDLRDHARQILPLLTDTEDQIRHLAASILAKMEAKEAGPELAQRLKDAKGGGGIARLLLEMGDDKHLDACVRRLSAASPHDTALALGRWGALRPASADRVLSLLGPFQKDPSEGVQDAVEIALIRMGRKDRAGLRRFLEEDLDGPSPLWREALEVLAHLDERERFEKLGRAFELKRAIESEEELREILFEETGLRLEAERPMGWGGRMAPGVRTTGARLLDRYLSGTWMGLVIRDQELTYVLDQGKIRVLTPEKARHHGRGRLTK